MAAKGQRQCTAHLSGQALFFCGQQQGVGLAVGQHGQHPAAHLGQMLDEQRLRLLVRHLQADGYMQKAAAAVGLQVHGERLQPDKERINRLDGGCLRRRPAHVEPPPCTRAGPHEQHKQQHQQGQQHRGQARAAGRKKRFSHGLDFGQAGLGRIGR